MLLSNLRTDLNQLVHLNQLSQTPVRTISFFGFGKKKDDATAGKSLDADLIEQKGSVWEHLNEDQVEQIRNRSGLSTKERDRLRGRLSQRIFLTEAYQYKTTYVRNLYAMFGRESGLKPGVCWPRRDELAFKKQYDEAFHPPLDQLMRELKEEQDRKAKEIADREDEIRKGLKKLAKYKKEFYERFNKVQSEKKEKEDKEQKRIEEICDFLGYSLSPNDPRFEAAAEKKAEIERKEQLKKGVAKKSKQARMLDELKALIEKNQMEEDKKKAEAEQSAKAASETDAEAGEQDKASDKAGKQAASDDGKVGDASDEPKKAKRKKEKKSDEDSKKDES